MYAYEAGKEMDTQIWLVPTYQLVCGENESSYRPESRRSLSSKTGLKTIPYTVDESEFSIVKLILSSEYPKEPDIEGELALYTFT